MGHASVGLDAVANDKDRPVIAFFFQAGGELRRRVKNGYQRQFLKPRSDGR